ncbi:hypothetical protein FALCPG4_018728 [Fusarium falciforme]
MIWRSGCIRRRRRNQTVNVGTHHHHASFDINPFKPPHSFLTALPPSMRPDQTHQSLHDDMADNETKQPSATETPAEGKVSCELLPTQEVLTPEENRRLLRRADLWCV